MPKEQTFAKQPEKTAQPVLRDGTERTASGTNTPTTAQSVPSAKNNGTQRTDNGTTCTETILTREKKEEAKNCTSSQVRASKKVSCSTVKAKDMPVERKKHVSPASRIRFFAGQQFSSSAEYAEKGQRKGARVLAKAG